MTKPGIRDSLVNMLGEFVGLSKTPEYRLSNSSEQFLADAIKEEKKASVCSTSSRGSLNIYIGMVSVPHHVFPETFMNKFSLQEPIQHQRSNSTPIRVKSNSEEIRRLSVPLLRPKTLIKKFQHRHSSGSYAPNPEVVIIPSRQNSIISESDEEVFAELPKPKRTRNESQSSSILGDLAKSGHARFQPLMIPTH